MKLFILNLISQNDIFHTFNDFLLKPIFFLLYILFITIITFSPFFARFSIWQHHIIIEPSILSHVVSAIIVANKIYFILFKLKILLPLINLLIKFIKFDCGGFSLNWYCFLFWIDTYFWTVFYMISLLGIFLSEKYLLINF